MRQIRRASDGTGKQQLMNVAPGYGSDALLGRCLKAAEEIKLRAGADGNFAFRAALDIESIPLVFHCRGITKRDGIGQSEIITLVDLAQLKVLPRIDTALRSDRASESYHGAAGHQMVP